ncbi:CotH kinase family protein, partial [bacterium]|nr:CotH kinase family protein [bacterium]
STYIADMPLYRLLATEENLTEIEARPLESNILLSAGFIYDNQPFYDVTIRYREANRERRGIRIELQGDERLHGEAKVNLSKYHALEEHVCAAFYETVGLPVYEIRDVRLLINTSYKGYHLDVERLDESFVERNFPYDSDGTLIRGRVEVIQGDSTAAIDHLWNKTLRRYDDPRYPELLDAEIDIAEWIQCLAAIAVSGDFDTLLGGLMGNQLNYQRPSDGRIVLLPFDMDEAWQSPRIGIHGDTTPNWHADSRIENFLLYPIFRRQYYEDIAGLIDCQFAPENVFPLIEDICARTGRSAYREQMLKAFVEQRIEHLEQVVENYIDRCEAFAPEIETNGGIPFFTDEPEVVIAGTVLPGSAGVEAFRVEGEPSNLLANGGFEEGANGWTLEDLPPNVAVSLDAQVSHSGLASIKLVIDGGNPDYYGIVQIVDCQPLTKYRLSYFIRAVEMEKGHMFVNVIDADNGEEYLSVHIPEQRQIGSWVWAHENSDWTYRSSMITTRENTHRLAVRLCRVQIDHYFTGEAKGQIWYDDLKLEEVSYGRQSLGQASYDASIGHWEKSLPLNQGENVFELVARPLPSRDYRAPVGQIRIYRSADVDQDDLADLWEQESFASLAWDAQSDPDGDQLTNETEFLLGTHPNLADSDGDSIPDGMEVTSGLDPLADNRWFDSDRDGLLDPAECLEHRTDPWDPDTDNDGLQDGWEVAHGLDPRFHFDALWDQDGDGLSSRDEYALGTNPTDEDTDDDLMPDGWEFSSGFDPTNGRDASEDADEDGQSNLAEHLADTDPHNPESLFAILPLKNSGGRIELVWYSVPGKTYQVFSSEDMDSWSSLGDPITADDIECSFVDDDVEERVRFYKVQPLR